MQVTIRKRTDHVYGNWEDKVPKSNSKLFQRGRWKTSLALYINRFYEYIYMLNKKLFSILLNIQINLFWRDVSKTDQLTGDMWLFHGPKTVRTTCHKAHNSTEEYPTWDINRKEVSIATSSFWCSQKHPWEVRCYIHISIYIYIYIYIHVHYISEVYCDKQLLNIPPKSKWLLISEVILVINQHWQPYRFDAFEPNIIHFPYESVGQEEVNVDHYMNLMRFVLNICRQN